MFDNSLENVEWERAKFCLHFLQTLYRATNLISDSNYPISHSMIAIFLNCGFAFLKFRSINGFALVINECLPK